MLPDLTIRMRLSILFRSWWVTVPYWELRRGVPEEWAGTMAPLPNQKSLQPGGVVVLLESNICCKLRD